MKELTLEKDESNKILKGINLPKDTILKKLRINDNTMESLITGNTAYPVSFYDKIIKKLGKIKMQRNREK